MKTFKECVNSFEKLLYGSISKKLILGFVIIVTGIFSIFNSSFLQSTNLFLEHQTLALGIVMLLSLMILYGYCFFTIINPLKKMLWTAKSLEKGNLNERVYLRTKDEFEELSLTLNNAMESLQQAQKGREQLEKAKSEFLSVTGHELRSPMTPIKAQLQLLMGGYFGKLSKKQTEHLSIILRNTDRLDSILNDYLEIARIDAGRLKFNYTKTKLQEPIKKLLEEMKAFKPEKKIKLSSEINSTSMVVVDVEKLLRVLKNLIINAIKFSSQGGKVIVKLTHSQNRIHFKVEDSGIGIDPSNARMVFDPFFQEDHKLNREYEGSGLGLTIAKGLVRSQGGEITITPRKGKGTTVSFTIPSQPTKKPVAVPIMMPYRKKGLNK